MPNVVAAALLLVWGASLALSGLGLGATAAALALNRYWPVLFLALGVWGLVPRRLWGAGRSFYAVMVGASLLLLASTISVPGFNVGDLVWAAVIVGAGVWLVARRRWWRW
jgi:hypothetical protein